MVLHPWGVFLDFFFQPSVEQSLQEAGFETGNRRAKGLQEAGFQTSDCCGTKVGHYFTIGYGEETG